MPVRSQCQEISAWIRVILEFKFFFFDVWEGRIGGQSQRKRQNKLTKWLPDNVECPPHTPSPTYRHLSCFHWTHTATYWQCLGPTSRSVMFGRVFPYLGMRFLRYEFILKGRREENMFCNHKRLSSLYMLSNGFPQYNRRQTRVSLVVGRQKPDNFPRFKGGKLFA